MHRFSRFSLIRRSRKVESASRSLSSHNVTWIYFIVPHYMPDLNRKSVSLELDASLVAARASPSFVEESFRDESRRERGAKIAEKEMSEVGEPPFARAGSRRIRGKHRPRIGRISRLVYLKSRTSWTHNARIVTPGIQISRGASLIDGVGDGIGGDDAPDTREWDISSERNRDSSSSSATISLTTDWVRGKKFFGGSSKFEKSLTELIFIFDHNFKYSIY